MTFRIRASLIVAAISVATFSPARAAGPEPTGESPAAEAERLYDRANDYVSSIKEGEYSYSYIQFYWKHAQSDLDRVMRVYGSTPAGAALKSGQSKIGPFELGYFKERVLFRVEEKRQAAVDSIQCAIFLCGLKGDVWDDARREAIFKVIEVLSRQQRWGEAFDFNAIQSADKNLQLQTIFRVAARYEQNDIIKQMLKSAPKENLTAYHTILGEALALRGLPRKDIAALLDQDSADQVKLAILSGMIQREVKIQLAATMRLPLENVLLLGDTIKRPAVRDDVNVVAQTFFPTGNPAAKELLESYKAALGARPALSAATPVHLAYLDYLAAAEKFDELGAYLLLNLPRETRSPAELKVIELLAQAGRIKDAEHYRAPYVAAGGILAEKAELAEFRGQMNSTEIPLTVHEKTLGDLPFHDPAFLAQAMMEWSLTPNRSIRGPAPYDAVVYKFAPGFADLQPPKSKAAGEAASTQKQF